MTFRRGDSVTFKLFPRAVGLVLDVWTNSTSGQSMSVLWGVDRYTPAMTSAQLTRSKRPFKLTKGSRARLVELERHIQISIDKLQDRAAWLADYLNGKSKIVACDLEESDDV